MQFDCNLRGREREKRVIKATERDSKFLARKEGERERERRERRERIIIIIRFSTLSTYGIRGE